MRSARLACLALLLVPALAAADSKNAADYPLRIHIFKRSETTFYHHRSAEESKGDGHADLFENGTAHAVDFTFECDEKLHDSLEFETYPAKWKKQGQQLTVLLPVYGKTGKFFTCNFNTDVKDFAYFTHSGNMRTEPVEAFKAWMVKHNYDPEHGLNSPTNLKPSDPPAAAPPAPAVPPPAQ